jgi:two-component system LytT family response regulator
VLHSALERFGDAMGQGPITRLFIRAAGALVPVAVGDVSYFSADGDYVAAHVERARHLLHLSLTRLEARLDPQRFLRIHRAHIVNLDRLKTFRKSADGSFVAELDDGTRLPVSRARAQELRRLGV